jgi:protein SEY1
VATAPHPLATPAAVISYSDQAFIILPFPGIWMCRAQDMNLLVMDVEGTDGRERGEDKVCLLNSGRACCLTIFKDFERKSTAFTLASSEVLIINLWEHQVGLYQGANMSLLKTVFEVNLELFGNKSQER